MFTQQRPQTKAPLQLIGQSGHKCMHPGPNTLMSCLSVSNRHARCRDWSRTGHSNHCEASCCGVAGVCEDSNQIPLAHVLSSNGVEAADCKQTYAHMGWATVCRMMSVGSSPT